MNRVHYLAAEMHGYSYEHYQEKLEMRHIRFTKHMPDYVKVMELAEKEQWSDEMLADKLEVDLDKVGDYKKSFILAKRIVDSENSAKSYIEGIKASVKIAVDSGITDEQDINNLVSQILYRTVDFGFLLKNDKKELHQYSRILKDYGEELSIFQAKKNEFIP